MINFLKNISNNYKSIYLGLLTALLFSAFIYFEHYAITNKLINTIFGLSAIALFLYIPKKAVLVAGFFIGLLWFYWIGYSFKYTGVGYLTPFVTLGFAVIYMLFFGILALSKEPIIRAILLLGLSFFYPFDFNWMQIELVFINSYIGVYKYQFIILLLGLSLPYYIKKPYKYAPLILILFAFNFHYPKQTLAPLKIKLIQTNIKQEKKWLRSSLIPTIDLGFNTIEKAIKNSYDVVVLPESFFPIFMNRHPILIQELEFLSKQITIISGSLLNVKGKNYNVTYMFQDGNYTIAKKLILVPFGEYIPLPKFARKFINDTFFAGESDFETAKKPTDFIIKGIKFRNAICYEATSKELYKGDVKYMIATSNNAWFAPSIEPTIQKLLMEFYARKNGVTIYHSANYKGMGIIR